MFVHLFRRYGLPERTRTDNRQPFASNALGRLSTLSVWWVRLGIRPELIEPAHSEQNGRHERMHKTLEAATATGVSGRPAALLRRVPRALQHRATVRSARERHAGELLCPSLRPYRGRFEPLVYPGHDERRLVSWNGGVRWNKRWVNVSHLFAELEVGFEEIDDGLWNMYLGPVWLGRFHEAVRRILDQCGRAIRHRRGNHNGGNNQNVLPIT